MIGHTKALGSNGYDFSEFLPVICFTTSPPKIFRGSHFQVKVTEFLVDFHLSGGKDDAGYPGPGYDAAPGYGNGSYYPPPEAPYGYPPPGQNLTVACFFSTFFVGCVFFWGMGRKS